MKRLTCMTPLLAGSLLVLLAFPGCDKGASNTGPASAADTTQVEPPALPSNRVAIPSAVRSNLGITFAKAERRHIKDTLRAPGRFEYLPTAKREYRTMLPGRVDILVEQFQHVEPGTPLYRIDSPTWRTLMKDIAEMESTISELRTSILSHEDLYLAHMMQEKNLRKDIEIWSERVTKLEALRDAGGGSMKELTSARSSLAKANGELHELREQATKHEVQHDLNSVSLESAMTHLDLTLESAASLAGMEPEDLLFIDSTSPGALPTWLTMNDIEVRAIAPGIVDAIDLTNGTWAETGSNVLTTVQPERVRFHAFGLQSDLGVLKDGLEAMIVPPTPTAAGHSIPMDETMRGTLVLGPSGNAQDRTIDLYVTPEELASWARPGVSAQLEIVTDESNATELSIPLAAVQRDGLMPVIFRRAPDNPNEAIRIDADLGLDDGRWVAILSGLRDGDEVVLDGGFQLMLATSGSIQKGGHFHADGTFHEGEH